jgi:hypothetical protein
MIRFGDRFDADGQRWMATSTEFEHGGAVGLVVRAAPVGVDLMSKPYGEEQNVQIDDSTVPVRLPKRRLPA